MDNRNVYILVGIAIGAVIGIAVGVLMGAVSPELKTMPIWLAGFCSYVGGLIIGDRVWKRRHEQAAASRSTVRPNVLSQPKAAARTSQPPSASGPVDARRRARPVRTSRRRS